MFSLAADCLPERREHTVVQGTLAGPEATKHVVITRALQRGV
jgi:hypothetical protein